MTAENQYASAADMVAAEVEAAMDVTNGILERRENAKTKNKQTIRNPKTGQQQSSIEVLEGGKEQESGDELGDSDKGESRKRSKLRERSNRLRQDPWVPARFRIRESKEYALHQIYHQLKLKGQSDITQQGLVDEALDWLMKKYK